MACMNLTLAKSDTTFNSDGSLLTIYSSQIINSSGYFTSDNNDSITVCFPFTNYFLHCLKWVFEESDYHARNNIITIDPTKKEYQLGDYKFGPRNSVEVCVPDQLIPQFNTDVIFTIAWGLSIIFLIISCILRINFPLRNHDNKPIILHKLSIVANFSFLVIHQIQDYESSTLNWFLVLGSQLSSCSVYSWLNVVNFDVWSTFRQRQIHIRFIWKSLYAFGLPVVVTAVITVSEELLENTHEPLKIIRGGFAVKKHWYWLLGVVLTIMVLINLAFMIATVTNLHKAGNSAKLANSKVHRTLIMVYLKMMVLMGITFICPLLIIIVPTDMFKYLFITDLLTSLHGVMLCVISNATIICKVLHGECPKKRSLASRNYSNSNHV